VLQGVGGVVLLAQGVVQRGANEAKLCAVSAISRQFTAGSLSCTLRKYIYAKNYIFKILIVRIFKYSNFYFANNVINAF